MEMDNKSKRQDKKMRVLMFSQKNIHKQHYRCSLYEFEDIIGEIDAIDIIAPVPNKWFEYGSRLAGRIAKDYALLINPGIPKTKITNNYDLFFAVCQYAKDLLHLEGLEGWTDNCKTSICWLNEIWVSDLYSERRYLKILSKFDYVILNCSQSVCAVSKTVPGECFYLPPGIDAILFCPYPQLSPRLIDVYSIGRKSEITHRALLNMVRSKGIFYIYDSVIGEEVIDRSQHRLLFANIAKRSKYFVVNPGKIDLPGQTNGQTEFGSRYFEGAASGTILIGERPENEEFKKIFAWPDAVIHLPYDSDRIDVIINELDNQAERQDKIRRNNVVAVLTQHDWVYRWEAILKLAGLEPMHALLERKNRLLVLSDLVKKSQ